MAKYAFQGHWQGKSQRAQSAPIIGIRVHLQDGTWSDFAWAADPTLGFQPGEEIELPNDPRVLRHMATHPEWKKSP